MKADSNIEENQVSMTAPLSNNTELSKGNRIAVLFANPMLDKVMAVIAILPFVVTALLILRRGILDVVRLTLLVQWLVFVVTMLIRRTPVRVTTKFWYWLLAFVGTYWVWLVAVFTAPGTIIIPHWGSIGLAWLGLIIMVYARVSLGRNIGLVPAQRQLVTTGAYRLVRHPIYTAMFVNYLAFALNAYSPGNVIIAVVGALWFVIKSFVEEWFLSADPEYVEYMQRVRWRWIPWIV